MEQKLSPEMRELKQEYDFIHKKLGDLQWELATVWLGKPALFSNEIDTINDQIDNYTDNMNILIEKIQKQVQTENHKNGVRIKIPPKK